MIEKKKKIILTNFANSLKTAPGYLNKLTTGIKELNKKLAEKGTNPAEFFSNNPRSLQDLKIIYIIMYLMNAFSKKAYAIRVKMSAISGNYDAAKNRDQQLQQLMDLSTRGNTIYKKFNVKNQIKNASAEFSNFFINNIVKQQDMADGGKGATAMARARDAAGGIEVEEQGSLRNLH